MILCTRRLILLLICLGSFGITFKLAWSGSQVRQFDSIFEPSGIQLLPDGRIIVIEDEKIQSLSVLTVQSDGNITSKPLGRGFVLDWIIGKPVLGAIEDLEGITMDNNGYVYAITSHSRTTGGNLTKGREKLVRFRIDGNSVVDPLVKNNIKRKILKKHDDVKKAMSLLKGDRNEGFNIEALEFDRNTESLFVGLRSPVIKKKAVIAIIDNPIAAFEDNKKIKISNDLILLDLDRGGIRGLVYDPILDGFLILSRREDKKDKPFKLWFWSGERSNSPRRIRIDAIDNIDHAEGISPVRIDGKEKLLIVFDNGNTFSGKGGEYMLISYDQLTIESIRQ